MSIGLRPCFVGDSSYNLPSCRRMLSYLPSADEMRIRNHYIDFDRESEFTETQILTPRIMKVCAALVLARYWRTQPFCPVY